MNAGNARHADKKRGIAMQLPASANLKSSRWQKISRRIYKERELWVLGIIALAWLVVFAYVPMYGIIYSFFNYAPGKTLANSQFVGLKYFIDFFRLPDVWKILRNTLVISSLGLTVGFSAPVILALLFNELVFKTFKRIAQTISYLPHFVSWVVVASMVFNLLGNDGVVNEILVKIGAVQSPIDFLGEGKFFWALITSANIWKGIGWSTIIYISAIAGIDQELYQAGAVDGLGRWGMARHITLPGIATTIVLLFVLGMGDILNAGFEQQLLLGTPKTREYYDVIDTFVYRYGIQMGRHSFAIAVGFMKSLVGLALVFLTNAFSRKITDMSIL